MRPSQASIDLDALQHNYRLACSLAPHSSTLAVIKANAYGHGTLPVAKALSTLAPVFAVACTEEALELRAAGINQPILLLEGFFQRDEIALAAEQNFWPMIENQWQIAAIVEASPPTPLNLWLKVDTGMHRLGLPLAEAKQAYETLVASNNLRKPIVIATHFASADELENPFTLTQIERIQALASHFGAPLSMSNSPGLLGWPRARSDWNRPGYMLYGNTPFAAPHPEGDKLIPVMSFESAVMSLRTIPAGDTVGYGGTWRAQKESVIATIPVGYGDGYPRNAPSGTPIMIAGQRAALAGRVSMDLITVDVTGLNNIQRGSKVELWGRNLAVGEVAASASTSGYELLTRMSARLRRHYLYQT
jgi:alanine racemase